MPLIVFFLSLFPSLVRADGIVSDSVGYVGSFIPDGELSTRSGVLVLLLFIGIGTTLIVLFNKRK